MAISIQDITIVLVVSIAISFLILYSQSLQKIKKINKTIIELELKNTILEQRIESVDSSINYDNHKENFIKFLSDSRDWAFEYIDQSQKQIKEFIDLADKEFAFFDSFGSLTQEYPHYEEMKKISQEYKKLKSLLPEENNDRR